MLGEVKDKFENWSIISFHTGHYLLIHAGIDIYPFQQKIAAGLVKTAHISWSKAAPFEPCVPSVVMCLSTMMGKCGFACSSGDPGPLFTKKTPSYQYKNSLYKPLYNGDPYTRKAASF